MMITITTRDNIKITAHIQSVTLWSKDNNYQITIHPELEQCFMITEDEYKMLQQIIREYNKVNYMPVVAMIDEWELKSDDNLQ